MAPGHRLAVPQVLVALATLSVAVHLYGLYRPTGPPAPGWFPNVDKLEHLLGFGLPVALILLARAALDRRRPGPDRTTRAHRSDGPFTLVVVGAFALHAVLSELVQHFFYTSRSGDPLDLLADWAGVALGWGAARLLTRRRAGATIPDDDTVTRVR
jgi:hypothetical protein